MTSHKYFAIPFENVPENPTYTVWFATWTTERPVEPGMSSRMVVGCVTEKEQLPAGAALLGTGSKDPLPPPPPPPPELRLDLGDYKMSVDAWLMIGRDEDEQAG